MGLESATFISQLDNANPLGGDPINQGDDHIRLVKSVLQTQFPNITAAALNATVVEFNKLVGLLASTAELNTMNGILSTTAELNRLQSYVGTLNRALVSDGSGNIVVSPVTVAELNLLDGLLASTSELNILNGATLSTAELNFVDGVTSLIQGQLNGKAPTAHSHTGAEISALDAADTTTGTFNQDRVPTHTGDVTGQTNLTLAAVQTALTTAANLTAVGKIISLITNGNILMDEEANVSDPGVGNARYWTKDDVPNIPMFTDDTDVDYGIVIADIPLKIKVVDIGDWNMDLTGGVNIAHGLAVNTIRSVVAMIRSDAGSNHYPLDMVDSSTNADAQGGYGGISGSNITLLRLTDGFFDGNTNFDATSFNRGWVTIHYV